MISIPLSLKFNSRITVTTQRAIGNYSSLVPVLCVLLFSSVLLLSSVAVCILNCSASSGWVDSRLFKIDCYRFYRCVGYVVGPAPYTFSGKWKQVCRSILLFIFIGSVHSDIKLKFYNIVHVPNCSNIYNSCINQRHISFSFFILHRATHCFCVDTTIYIEPVQTLTIWVFLDLDNPNVYYTLYSPTFSESS